MLNIITSIDILIYLVYLYNIIYIYIVYIIKHVYISYTGLCVIVIAKMLRSKDIPLPIYAA